jgi:hypothetical protein
LQVCRCSKIRSRIRQRNASADRVVNSSSVSGDKQQTYLCAQAQSMGEANKTGLYWRILPRANDEFQNPHAGLRKHWLAKVNCCRAARALLSQQPQQWQSQQQRRQRLGEKKVCSIGRGRSPLLAAGAQILTSFQVECSLFLFGALFLDAGLCG